MLKKIYVTRAEGRADECGKQHVFESFADAHKRVRLMARSAPKGGGYDKTDVVFVFDGLEEGEDTSIGLRFDMTYDHATAAEPLRSEGIAHCRFYSGERRPSHISEENYDRILSCAESKYRKGSNHRAIFKAAAEALETAK
jgi:hypothetical protein